MVPTNGGMGERVLVRCRTETGAMRFSGGKPAPDHADKRL